MNEATQERMVALLAQAPTIGTTVGSPSTTSAPSKLSSQISAAFCWSGTRLSICNAPSPAVYAVGGWAGRGTNSTLLFCD